LVIVDANVMLYAYWSQFVQHAISRTWLSEALSGTERVGFPGLSLLAYLRIATSGRVVFPTPTIEDACADLDACLAAPVAMYLGDSARTWPLLRAQLVEHRVRGNLTNDAYLAALALEHGATVVTFDRDFARFANVRVRYLDGATLR